MPADNYKLTKEISMEWIIEPLATPPVDGGNSGCTRRGCICHVIYAPICIMDYQHQSGNLELREAQNELRT